MDKVLDVTCVAKARLAFWAGYLGGIDEPRENGLKGVSKADAQTRRLGTRLPTPHSGLAGGDRSLEDT
eukprot:886122-Prymnesium_polylepis.2